MVKIGESWSLVMLYGQESKWMRVEFSQGVIHGHPITEQEYKKLIKPK